MRTEKIPVWFQEFEIGEGVPSERTYNCSGCGPKVGDVVLPSGMGWDLRADHVMVAKVNDSGQATRHQFTAGFRRLVEIAVGGEFGCRWEPSRRPVDQSAPVANENPATWDVVIAEVVKARTRHVETVEDNGVKRDVLLPNPAMDNLIAHMRERDRIGRERYGVPLQAHNGRDSLRDTLEELLDACVYAENAHIESGPDESSRSLKKRMLARDVRDLALRVERLILEEGVPDAG